MHVHWDNQIQFVNVLLGIQACPRSNMFHSSPCCLTAQARKLDTCHEPSQKKKPCHNYFFSYSGHEGDIFDILQWINSKIWGKNFVRLYLISLVLRGTPWKLQNLLIILWWKMFTRFLTSYALHVLITSCFSTDTSRGTIKVAVQAGFFYVHLSSLHWSLYIYWKFGLRLLFSVVPFQMREISAFFFH